MRKIYPKKSILVIRIIAIGDIVMASPLATSIKQNNPKAKVTWVVHPSFKPLLEDHPDVDNLVTFDLDEWEILWKKKSIFALINKARALRKTLETFDFDIALDLQGSALSGLIAWLSKAPHRIALGSEGGNAWFMTKTISKNLGDQTQIGSEYRYLASQLGYPDNEWKMHIPTSDMAKTSVHEMLKDKVGDAPYAVVCPFAKYEQKNWFEDYWQQIILRIRGRYQLRTVIVGGANGKESGDRIARLSGAINLAGKTSITETSEIIRGASLLIGVDTGLTHMGHAVKIPTIALFGSTYPYAYTGSELSKVIFLDHFCSPCRRKPICNKQYTCMRDITPDKVLTAIKPLMHRNNQDDQPS